VNIIEARSKTYRGKGSLKVAIKQYLGQKYVEQHNTWSNTDAVHVK